MGQARFFFVHFFFGDRDKTNFLKMCSWRRWGLYVLVLLIFLFLNYIVWEKGIFWSPFNAPQWWLSSSSIDFHRKNGDPQLKDMENQLIFHWLEPLFTAIFTLEISTRWWIADSPLECKPTWPTWPTWPGCWWLLGVVMVMLQMMG